MVDPSLHGAYPMKSLSRFADIISRSLQVKKVHFIHQPFDYNKKQCRVTVFDITLTIFSLRCLLIFLSIDGTRIQTAHIRNCPRSSTHDLKIYTAFDYHAEAIFYCQILVLWASTFKHHPFYECNIVISSCNIY